MGLNFDDSGRYIKWSNLFDFNSLQTLEASELLPYGGTKRRYKINDLLNVDKSNSVQEEMKEVAEAERALKQQDGDTDENKIKRIKAYKKLIKALHATPEYLEETEGIKYTYILYNIESGDFTQDEADDIMKKINAHEFYEVPHELTEGALKNFISSRIQKIVNAPLNLIEAYTNVNMEDLRDAADESPIGQQTRHMSSWNPSSILLLQNLNMIGKNVIAITAITSKGTNAWYWTLQTIFNEADKYYRAADETKDEKLKKKMLDMGDKILKLASFNFQSSRIKGRSKGSPELINIHWLPDFDVSKAVQRLQNEVNLHRISTKGRPSTASIRSQLMSAATKLYWPL